MISVLLAAPVIPPGCLDMTVGRGADPDVRPGGRDGEGADAFERADVGDDRSIRFTVNKQSPFSRAADARLDVAGRDAALMRTLNRLPIDSSAVAFLVRHMPCPGFTGEATGQLAWEALFRSTAEAQFGRIAWPGEVPGRPGS